MLVFRKILRTYKGNDLMQFFYGYYEGYLEL